MSPRSSPPLPLILLALGFLGAIALRVTIGGAHVAQSATAGLLFAACLVALSVTYGVRIVVTKRIILVGLVGAAALCVPALLTRILAGGGSRPFGNYGYWAIVVSLVALAEELFLRGVLFDALQKWRGNVVAVVVAAVAFSILHIPLYGWQTVPLDLAAGVWLGLLRLASGSWVAPGFTHTLADLASWWLR